jgi:hypothetical protein
MRRASALTPFTHLERPGLANEAGAIPWPLAGSR